MRGLSFLLLVLVMAIVVACGQQNASDHAAVGEVMNSAASASHDTASPSSGAGKGSIGGMAELAPLPEPTNPSIISEEQARPGLLTAGEWRDLDHWDWWLKLMNERQWSEFQEYWGFSTYQRVSIIVEHDGAPVSDVHVSLINGTQELEWQARTNHKGEAELFVNIFKKQEASPYQIVIETKQERKTVGDIKFNQAEPMVVQLEHEVQPSTNLDLMFVVDTTGSMADELQFLSEELRDVISRVKRDNDNRLHIRLSTNFYRDHGDEYVLRSFPFHTDIDRAIKQISNQSAEGGGDYEEAVEEALADAIFEHQWSDHAKARLLFLVLDAPPHENESVIASLQESVAEAANLGIRMIPVASSGIDKNTEFLLRLMSIATGGSYVFLTDDSGIGNAHIEPTIGPYQVELLNDLLVRIVNDYVQ